MRRNVASQYITFILIDSATGGAKTGATVSTYVTKDSGSQASGAGSVTEKANGEYTYAPSQTETDAAMIGFTFTASGAIPAHLTVFTSQLDQACTQLSAVPSTTGSLRDMLQFLFEYFRNRRTVTASTETLYKEDASTALGTATLSDNGSTFDKGEMN